jgi:hypothetical protein
MNSLELSPAIAIEAARLDREIAEHAFGTFGFSVVCHNGRISRVVRHSELSVKLETEAPRERGRG